MTKLLYSFSLILSDVQGWEKEAKQNVNIEMIDDPSTKRRKTIYDLEAYAASGPTESDISKLGTVQAAVKRPREIRYSISMVNIFLYNPKFF